MTSHKHKITYLLSTLLRPTVGLRSATIHVAVIAMMGCSGALKHSPENTTTVQLPGRQYSQFRSARWAGADHVIALSGDMPAKGTPKTEPIVQSHQVFGHENPSSPRVADVVKAAPVRPVTLLYASGKTCVGKVLADLSWAGPMGMRWRPAITFDGCPASPKWAIEGAYPELRLHPGPWRTSMIERTAPDLAHARATAPLVPRHWWSHGGTTLLIAGSKYMDIAGSLFIFEGETLIYREPRAKLALILQQGKQTILQIGVANVDGRFVKLASKSATTGRCGDQCWSRDRQCVVNAGAGSNRIEAKIECTHAYRKCIAKCRP